MCAYFMHVGEFETSFIDSQQNKSLVWFINIVDSAQEDWALDDNSMKFRHFPDFF